MESNTPREEIFRVEIQADAAIKTLADYNTAIAENTEKLNELKKANEQETQEYAKLSQVLATQKRERRELQKVIQNDVKLQREEQTSLKGMRAALSNLTKQYDELSAAERSGAKGEEMREHINRITTELKKAEEETQRYYRNVGNYEQSVKKALAETKAELIQLNYAYDNLSADEKQSAKGREMARKLEELTSKAGAMKDAMAAAGQQIKNAASDTRALDTLNEAAQLTAAGFGLMESAATAFGMSEESAEEVTKRMAVIMQTLNSLQTVQNLLQKESNIMMAVRNVQTWAQAKADAAAAAAVGSHGVALAGATIAQKAFNAVANANPYVLLATAILSVAGAVALLSSALSDSATEEEKARQRMDELTHAANENAAQELARAKILYDSATKAAKGTKERTEAVKELQKTYPTYFSNMNAENATVAQLRKQYQLLTQDIIASATARAAEDKLTEAIKRRFDIIERYQKRVRQGEQAAGNALAEAGLEAAEKYGQIDSLKDLAREFGDVNKEIEQYTAIARTARRDVTAKPDVVKPTKTAAAKAGGVKKTDEEKAAEKAAQDAAKRLENLRNELLNSYAKLEEDTAKSADDSVEDINKYYGLQLAALRTHFAELGELSDEEQTAYNALYDGIIQKRDEAIAKFLKDADENEQRIKAELAKQNEETFGLQIENAAENSPEKMALELQLLQMQYEQKLQLHKGNEEMLTALTAENERKRAEIMQQYAEAQRETLYSNAASVAGAMGNAAAMLEKFAGKSKAAAIASKSLAVGEILVNQGVAVAKGIKQAQSVPFPANIGAIASTIAAILAGVTSAMRAVNSAKFATGGYISGAGTSTSDSIPARLSNGESVINANSTALFTGLLSALNQIGGGVPIQAGETAANIAGEAMLARAFAMGAAALPAPVVSVVDINTTAARLVQTKERATL